MILRAVLPLATVTCLCLTTSAADAQSVRLTLAGGRATLHAENATPSAILAEWARLGGTRIVDAERLTGAPLTLTLESVPEREALDIVLRSAAGYIAAARASGSVGVSAFDRIIVLPVSTNAASARSGPAPAPAAAAMMPIVQQEAGSDVQQVEAPMVADDGSAGAEQPVSSTDFDYANPQRYFAALAAQQRAAEAAAQDGSTGDGTAAEPAAATGPGGFSLGTLLNAPGTIPVPPSPQPANGANGSNGTPAANPYGLPADAAPGSSTAPPMEPDRAKYINPYAPTPRPPDR